MNGPHILLFSEWNIFFSFFIFFVSIFHFIFFSFSPFFEI